VKNNKYQLATESTPYVCEREKERKNKIKILKYLLATESTSYVCETEKEKERKKR